MRKLLTGAISRLGTLAGLLGIVYLAARAWTRGRRDEVRAHGP